MLINFCVCVILNRVLCGGDDMIPKKINYCWFGRSPLPARARRCIESWRRFCPDYEIVEWNEDNFDISSNGYTKMCAKSGKYAFLSDYVRLAVVYEHGGLYFDTDVEVVRALTPLLGHDAFFGFETDKYVATGLGFGAEAGNPVVGAMLREYHPLFDGKSGVVGCPVLNTRALQALGLRLDGSYQELDGAAVYPSDRFNPYNDATGRLYLTENTYTIHWYSKSWMSRTAVLRSKLTRPLHRLGLGHGVRSGCRNGGV